MRYSTGARVPEPDLLTIARGLVVAPAGCGKTELIARALHRHRGDRPVLVLTHTNAGVAAMRARLSRAQVPSASYRLATIDGWAMRLIGTFPRRSGHDPTILTGRSPNYVAVRQFAAGLLATGHVNDVIGSSYARLMVDEYQDCSRLQHSIVAWLAQLLPTTVVGDPMQAIFGFDARDPLAGWEAEVSALFPLVATLSDPWRWTNAGADVLGRWLLAVRSDLEAGRRIDVRQAPAGVQWVPLDGTVADHPKRLAAARTSAPVRDGTVLIIGESRSPAGQQSFASQTPGAVTVEAVDLKDLVDFAESVDLSAADATSRILHFAGRLMTNVGPAEMLQRLESLRSGRARNPASAAERAALEFEADRCHSRVATLLAELNRQSEVRVYRPAVLRACMQALQRCHQNDVTFAEATVSMREEYRVLGRAVPRRAVGSTLLLKGLEADVAVILHAGGLDARNLYVAMTRGSRQLVICSSSPLLG